jgi:hypothetical protein
LPARRDPEIDLGDVAQAERRDDPLGHAADLLENHAGQRRRTAPGHRPAVVVLEIVVVDRVHARVRRVDDAFDRRHDSFERRQPLEVANGDVDPRDVRLDEQSLGVSGKHLFDRPGKVDRLVDHRALRDSLRRSLVVGLNDHRKNEVVEPSRAQRVPRDEPASRRGDAVAGDDLLGEGFVERDAEGIRIGARGRHPELLEEGGVETAPHLAASPLGAVEDQVRGVGLEPRDEPRRRPRHLDFLDVVPGGREALRQRVDRFGQIELGFVDGVHEAQVVGESNPHGQAG